MRPHKASSNPQLIAVQAQLEKLQEHFQKEIANVVSSLNAELAASRDEEQSLRQRMEQLRGAVSNENSSLIGLQGPLTKARATRSIYESFLNRATQLANVAGIQEQDASLVSAARVPLGPSAPQVARLLIVSAIFSLVLGIALAFRNRTPAQRVQHARTGRGSARVAADGGGTDGVPRDAPWRTHW